MDSQKSCLFRLWEASNRLKILPYKCMYLPLLHLVTLCIWLDELLGSLQYLDSFFFLSEWLFNWWMIFVPLAEPLPMRMRALPQSFWQQPNVPHDVSPANAYPILPPLINREGEAVSGECPRLPIFEYPNFTCMMPSLCYFHRWAPSDPSSRVRGVRGGDSLYSSCCASASHHWTEQHIIVLAWRKSQNQLTSTCHRAQNFDRQYRSALQALRGSGKESKTKLIPSVKKTQVRHLFIHLEWKIEWNFLIHVLATRWQNCNPHVH